MKANAQKQCRGTYFPQIAKLQLPYAREDKLPSASLESTEAQRNAKRESFLTQRCKESKTFALALLPRILGEGE